MSKKLIYPFLLFFSFYLIGSSQFGFYLKLAKSAKQEYADLDDIEEEKDSKEESESKTEDFKEKAEERIGNEYNGICLIIYYEEIFKRYHNNDVQPVRSAQLEIVPPPPKVFVL